MIVDKPSHITDQCWQALVDHKAEINRVTLRQLFKQEPLRHQRLSMELAGLYVDYSKNHVSEHTMDLLLTMAKEAGLSIAIKRLFDGCEVNSSEHNAAMHMALRAPASRRYTVAGEDVTRLVHDELGRMQGFVEALHAGDVRGYSGRCIDTVVHVGIGGSSLGPKFLSEALADFAVTDLIVHFVSNVDARAIYSVLQQVDAETTLVVVSSKSFATKETLLNAETAVQWLRDQGCDAPQAQLVAITAKPELAKKFGIKEEYIFRIWPWVGGRYSIWSAVGLPVAMRIGMKHFRDFLGGAFLVDEHFYSQPLTGNLAVLLALIDIWYINFLQAQSLAVFPYDDGLRMLPEYVGQLMMESNGKQVDHDGCKVGYSTASPVWGKSGVDAQHAYLQCLHQGSGLHPVDFVVGLGAMPVDRCRQAIHQRLMVASCIAQTEALMNGSGGDGNDRTAASHQYIPGNRPSTTIVVDEVTPAALGTLLCLYEHRCFVQAWVWNINPFDQWGVELGKQLSAVVYGELENGQVSADHDASTMALIERCLGR